MRLVLGDEPAALLELIVNALFNLAMSEELEDFLFIELRLLYYRHQECHGDEQSTGHCDQQVHEYLNVLFSGVI